MTQDSISSEPSIQHGVFRIAPEIELRDVTRTFETAGGVRVDALRGVSLSIRAGEFVAIRGPSGCGKSTLLNILGCLDRPSGGTYRVSSHDVSGCSADELARLRRQTFGFVFQSYNLLPSISALENVEIPAIYAGASQSARRERAVALLTKLGLAERLDHRPSQLSGGQQQRVSIARALMNGGRVILADEPTGALDSGSGEEIIELLSDLARRGHTVVVVTHDSAVAEKADRQIEMLDGRIVGDTGRSRSRTSSQLAPAASEAQREMGDRISSSAGEVAEATRMAMRSLRANPFRTSLTLLGVMIGVAAVVAMLAIGEGTKLRLVEEIDAMGANRLSIWPDTRAYPGAKLTFQDADVLVRSSANVKAVLPELSGSATVRIGNLDHSTTITATTANMPVVREWLMASGVFFDDDDSESLRTMAVLGATVLENLFPDGSDPLGQYVLVGNVPFLVIGTMTRKGAAGFGNRDHDDVVFVPLKTGARRLFGHASLRSLTVTVRDSSLIDQTEAEVRAALVLRHGREDFRVRNSVELQETMAQAMSVATLTLGAIGAISLLVGGIGVMNIMLVSVTERTREIGIRVATGARRSDILVQFLVEAVVVTGIGGLVGLVAGAAIALLVSALFPDVRVAFALAPMVIAFGCAAAVGLVFGYAPARNAARMDPVAALASE